MENVPPSQQSNARGAICVVETALGQPDLLAGIQRSKGE
jgi:hypothetical protein